MPFTAVRNSEEIAKEIVETFEGYVVDILDNQLAGQERWAIEQQRRTENILSEHILEQTGNLNVWDNDPLYEESRSSPVQAQLAAAAEIVKELFDKAKRRYGEAKDIDLPMSYGSSLLYGKALSEKREIKAVIDAVKNLCREPSPAKA